MIVNESNPLPEFKVQFPEREKLRMQLLPNYKSPNLPCQFITWEFLHERGVGNSFVYWLLFSSEWSDVVQLAGGCLRKLFNPREVIQDYDLFIDPNSFSSFCTTMYKIADSYEDKGCAHEFHIKGVKYQVIPFRGSPSNLADSFDFNINSQVICSKRLTSPSLDVINSDTRGGRNMSLTFTNSSKALLRHFPLQEGTIKFRVRLFQRMLKFLIQGYQMIAVERDALVSNIVSSNSNGRVTPQMVATALRTDSSNG